MSTKVSELNIQAVLSQKKFEYGTIRRSYRYERLSQGFWDLLARSLATAGNWLTSISVGIRVGYLAFHSKRTAHRKHVRSQGPIHISDSEASDRKRSLTAMGKFLP